MSKEDMNTANKKLSHLGGVREEMMFEPSEIPMCAGRESENYDDNLHQSCIDCPRKRKRK